jgi:hypothetical protein
MIEQLGPQCRFTTRQRIIVIQQAIWLYFRFPLSFGDVEDMLAERGIDVSYETVRRWALKFGAIIARKLRRGRGATRQSQGEPSRPGSFGLQFSINVTVPNQILRRFSDKP